ncbi:apses-domain-containing protein [Rhizophagus clarus]|uniref:Apses-domain-containing protein n=1 Tax=Rhizophagus clarus TaxID=94130 RepID=A0A8H3KZP7_9GLOM|nr:apses-domain-containing protein [Rhizophagus clarus]
MDITAPSISTASTSTSDTSNENLNNASTPPPKSPTIISTSLLATPSTPISTIPEVSSQIPRPNSGPIYSAVYSGVPVYEFLVRDVAVMRRRPDSYLNATQILKVAGLEKGKRTKIIEKEVLTGEHEKVQGGYGKYQGTWVPFERGKELAEQYGVLEILRPLLEYQPPKHDVPYSSSPYTPTKEQAMAALRRRNAQNNQNNNNNIVNGVPNGSVNFGHEEATERSEVSEPIQTISEIEDEERLRSILLAIYCNEDPSSIPELIAQVCSPSPTDYDLVLDEGGHTSLHWAAALGRLQIVELLLSKGSNSQKANYDGESVLVRSVLTTANYEAQTFPSIIELLRDNIHMTDKDNRSVFHHLALSGAVKGHCAPAKYYMDCLYEWITSHNFDISAVLNIQDSNGDTALNLATRLKQTHMCRQLQEMGANRQIENKVGLRPSDYSPNAAEQMEIDEIQENGQPQSTETIIDVFTQPDTTTYSNPRKRNREVVEVIHKMIEDAENEWIEQIRTKDEQINNTRNKYNRDSRLLIEAQRNMQWYRSQEKEYDETETRIKFLETVLRSERDEDQEDSALRKRQKLTHLNGNDSNDKLSVASTTISSPITQLPPIETTSSEPMDTVQTTTTDGSCNDSVSTSSVPNTDSLSTENTLIEQSKLPEIIITPPNDAAPPPLAQTHPITPTTMISRSTSDEMIDGEIRSLQAQIAAYIRDQELLKQEIEALAANTDRSEMQYKGIIASCCKLDIDKVDDFVESIISAIENDSNELNRDHIGAFMNKQ